MSIAIKQRHPTKVRIEEARKLLRAAPVRLHHVPNWLRLRMLKAFGCRNGIKMLAESCPRMKWGAKGLGEPLIAVSGLHCSLSSCLAEILEKLGVYMGASLRGGEDARLARFCEHAVPLPETSLQYSPCGRKSSLRSWLHDHFRAAGKRLAGAKHPLLCALAGDLAAVHSNLVVIHVARNLEESIQSLIDRNRLRPAEQDIEPEEAREHQLWLLAQLRAFLRVRQYYRVIADDLLSDPAREIDRLIAYLSRYGLAPTAKQRDAAVAHVDPAKATHTPAAPKRWTADTTVVVKSFERHGSCRRLIDSILDRWPEARILVADDSRTHPDWPDVRILKMPFDSGVSAGRNLLVKEAKTPYVLLMDDDVVFNEQTDIQSLRDGLESHGLDVAAGEPTGKRESWVGRFELRDGVLFLRPLEKKPEDTMVRQHAVENFFLARRQALLECPWDPELKIGEHIDWCIRAWQMGLKLATFFKVRVLETIERNPSYAKYRQRALEYRDRSLRGWAKRLRFRHFVNKMTRGLSAYNLDKTGT